MHMQQPVLANFCHKRVATTERPSVSSGRHVLEYQYFFKPIAIEIGSHQLSQRYI